MRMLTFEEALKEFPDAMDELDTEHGISDRLHDGEVLYVNDDGNLVFGETIDGDPPEFNYIAWMNEEWQYSVKDAEHWREGWMDGMAARRTSDRDRGEY